MKKLFINFVIIFFLSSLPVVGAPHDDLMLLYFFSATCSHCKNATPIVQQLSGEFKTRGILFGKKDAGSMPFPVERADKAVAEKFDVKGLPTLIVLQKGVVKQTIAGDRDIKDAPILLEAFREGALSVAEALARGPGKNQTVAGWIISRGEYFKDAHFFLTDRKQHVPVRPWLPLEAVKSPFKKARPRLMSDVVNRPVVLLGTLMKTETGLLFSVEKEVKHD